MSQFSLFESGPRTLIDDPRGRIDYVPDWLESALAADWFAQLTTGIDWRAERRQMYEREVDVPRLTAHYALDAAPAPLPEAAARVSAYAQTAFNSIGLNRYRDERDSVAPHNDRLDDLAVGAPIALLSLGATRRMQIRAKHAPRRLLEIDLEAGSLLLMSYAVQLHFDHGIPKEKAAVGPRISLAFRARPTPPE